MLCDNRSTNGQPCGQLWRLAAVHAGGSLLFGMLRCECVEREDKIRWLGFTTATRLAVVVVVVFTKFLTRNIWPTG